MIRVMKFTSRWVTCVAALALSAGCAGSSNGGTTRPLMSFEDFEAELSRCYSNMDKAVRSHADSLNRSPLKNKYEKAEEYRERKAAERAEVLRLLDGEFAEIVLRDLPKTFRVCIPVSYFDSCWRFTFQGADFGFLQLNAIAEKEPLTAFRREDHFASLYASAFLPYFHYDAPPDSLSYGLGKMQSPLNLLRAYDGQLYLRGIAPIHKLEARWLEEEAKQGHAMVVDADLSIAFGPSKGELPSSIVVSVDCVRLLLDQEEVFLLRTPGVDELTPTTVGYVRASTGEFTAQHRKPCRADRELAARMEQ